MAEEELAVVKLFRFDPEVNTEPRYETYEGVPYKGRTVLDVLQYLYKNRDSTFSFRWACTKGWCRSCIIAVNGKPTFACVKKAEKEMTIDPHPKFKVIKDLICDFMIKKK